uniref:Metallophos domain-containing protein n=1 Tax=Parastrongyloides trichosuri TaxID=131310 RepID=A0A0N4ZND1_PARTI
MTMSARKILYLTIFYCLGNYIIDVIGSHSIKHLEGYKYGNNRRFISVCKLGWLMGYLSFLAHFFLGTFFQEPFTYVKFTDHRDKFSPKILNKWRSLYVKSWIVLSLLAIGMYFLYFTKSTHNFLYFIMGIANGLWIHIFMFSFGFLVLTFIKGIMEKAQLGKKILDFLYKWTFTRKFIKDTQYQIIFTLLISTFLCLVQYIASNKVSIKYHTLKIKDLPKDAEGFRFALITDLHTGALVYKEDIVNVVEKVNDENVDSVFLVGDIIDGPYDIIKDRTEPLKYLKSKYGTYFVTGNHEYYYGNVQEWIDAFRNEYKFKILENEVTDLKGMCLVGLHDISASKNKIGSHVMNASIINSCEPKKPIIVLAHNPASTKEILSEAKERHIDLILSGHTHAGQYYVMIPYVVVFLPYFYGFYNIGQDTTLVVSAGTLYQAAPMKMPYLSEIHVFTLFNKEE